LLRHDGLHLLCSSAKIQANKHPYGKQIFQSCENKDR
jgi:hypothetical protein